MEDFSKIYELLTSNWEGILVLVSATAGVVAKACTLLNVFMPKTITNEKLAKIEAITSKLSFGTKKAEIKTK